MYQERVLSGMRPTGGLHLGHYHGVLKNWVELQHEFECLFFVADWHALTTHYDTPEVIERNVWEMEADGTYRQRFAKARDGSVCIHRQLIERAEKRQASGHRSAAKKKGRKKAG